MSGSRPDADAVTASAGTWSGLTPSRWAMAALRPAICAYRTSLSWDRLDAPDEDGSMAPSPSFVLSVSEKSDAAAEGRVWKYWLPVGLVPIRLDPTGWPL